VLTIMARLVAMLAAVPVALGTAENVPRQRSLGTDGPLTVQGADTQHPAITSSELPFGVSHMPYRIFSQELKAALANVSMPIYDGRAMCSILRRCRSMTSGWAAQWAAQCSDHFYRTFAHMIESNSADFVATNALWRWAAHSVGAEVMNARLVASGWAITDSVLELMNELGTSPSPYFTFYKPLVHSAAWHVVATLASDPSEINRIATMLCSGLESDTASHCWHGVGHSVTNYFLNQARPSLLDSPCSQVTHGAGGSLLSVAERHAILHKVVKTLDLIPNVLPDGAFEPYFQELVPHDQHAWYKDCTLVPQRYGSNCFLQSIQWHVLYTDEFGRWIDHAATTCATASFTFQATRADCHAMVAFHASPDGWQNDMLEYLYDTSEGWKPESIATYWANKYGDSLSKGVWGAGGLNKAALVDLFDRRKSTMNLHHEDRRSVGVLPMALEGAALAEAEAEAQAAVEVAAAGVGGAR